MDAIGVFGCGEIYKQFRPTIEKHSEIKVVLDNNTLLHGKELDGYPVICPERILEYEVDYVVLLSNYANSMRKQLLSYGYPENRIIHYADYLEPLETKRKNHPGKGKKEKRQRTLLILSNDFGYHGGAVIVFRMAKCAQQLGYKVTVAAKGGNRLFIEELNEAGVDVIIQDWLDYASAENLRWTSDFNVVMANTILMLRCAITLAENRRIMLWIHESPDSYEKIEYWKETLQQGLQNAEIELYSVSERAKLNFLNYFNWNKEIRILPAAVEDWYKENKAESEIVNTTFALIGSLMPLKGHFTLLSAIASIDNWENGKCLFIGKANRNDFDERVIEAINKTDRCVFVGEKGFDEIRKIYRDIDVFVVPSSEETFSMVAAEAMMMGKTCIVSDHCGIAEYIIDKENGFVFRTNDSEQLASIMEWCIDNRDHLEKIGEKARATYEKHFSMNELKRNIQKVFEECYN